MVISCSRRSRHYEKRDVITNAVHDRESGDLPLANLISLSKFAVVNLKVKLMINLLSTMVSSHNAHVYF